MIKTEILIEMDYYDIEKILKLDRNLDLEAAKVLSKILNEMLEKPDLNLIKNLIRNRYVIIFGAGPSLEEDITNIRSNNLISKSTIIAADGALTALMKNRIRPDILVTDLDGDIKNIKKANNIGVVTIVHAHGNNIEKLRRIVPGLKNVIGTTQIGKFYNLHNFGGFTDGDRAVFMTEKFKPELIFLAGMDFGSEIGRYSGTYNKEVKVKKLRIGKKLLEELAGKSRIMILNLTSRGEYLRNIPKISVRDAKNLILALDMG